jgi:uncharacterized protein YjbI with pentapeptide repeats
MLVLEGIGMFQRCDFSKCNLSGIRASGVLFSGSKFDGAILDGANLVSAGCWLFRCCCCCFKVCHLAFSSCSMIGCSFKGASLKLVQVLIFFLCFAETILQKPRYFSKGSIVWVKVQWC